MGMGLGNFGLSNFYMKAGMGLMVAALLAIAWTSFFSVDAGLQGMVRNAGAVVLLAGLVVYAIGRVARARGPR